MGYCLLGELQKLESHQRAFQYLHRLLNLCLIFFGQQGTAKDAEQHGAILVQPDAYCFWPVLDEDAVCLPLTGGQNKVGFCQTLHGSGLPNPLDVNRPGVFHL
jgi:hypothetical protein